MKIEIHVHNHNYSPDGLLHQKIDSIKMTQEEVVQKLDALTAQVGKVFGEVSGKLQELSDLLAAQGNVSPEVQTKLDELTAAVQGVDELIADQPGGDSPPTE